MKKANSVFKNWHLEREPYFTHDREGTDAKAMRFKIYEDENVKVCRVYEPTFFSEHENHIEVSLKNNLFLFDVPIGGCITFEDAQHTAQTIIKRLLKY